MWWCSRTVVLLSPVVSSAANVDRYRTARIMSEFSSGAFKPLGSPQQFPLDPHKFGGGVRASEAEDESYQDVQWRLEDHSILLEGVTVASDHDYDGGSFLVRPDSAVLTLASSVPFDHFGEHVGDEIFTRDAPSYEGSTSCNNLQLTSSSSAQLDELYGDHQGGGRWQATVNSDLKDRCNNSDLLDVIPVNSQETRTKHRAYHLHQASSSCSPFNSNFADSSSFPNFSPPSKLLGLLSSSSPGSGVSNKMSPKVAIATPLGLNYNVLAAVNRNSPFPISDSERKEFPGRLGRGGRGETRAAMSSISSEPGAQSMAALNYHQALRVVRTTSDFTIEKPQLYSARLASEHLEHVQRERQRRDDMSAKIATLETLLPPASKRDRVSILHDGIHYVKALQQKVKALQEQLREAKRKAAAAGVQDDDQRWSSLGGRNHTNLSISSSLDVTRPSAGCGIFTGGSDHQSKRARHDGPGLPNLSRLLDRIPKAEPIQNRGPVSVELHVQVDRPGEQVQVVKCECRYSYLSSVMRTLDQLQLSLHRCSVTKLHDYVICVIVIKPTSNCSTAHAVSSAQIATLLKIAAVEP